MKQPKEFQEAKETLATYMLTEIASKYIKADSTAEGRGRINGWYEVAMSKIEQVARIYEDMLIISFPKNPMATKKKVVAKKATPKKKVVKKSTKK